MHRGHSSTLSRLEAALAAADSHRDACATVVDHLAQHPDYKPSVYLDRGGRLRCLALRRYRQAFDGMAHSSGMIGRAFTTGEVCFSLDVAGDPDYLKISAGVQAEVAAPVVAGGAPIGVLNVESPAALDARDVAAIAACAAALGDRLAALGGALRETPAERLVRHATRLTDMQSRPRIEYELLLAACDVVELDSAVLLGATADGVVEALDAVGPLATALRATSPAALGTIADLVGSGTSCFSVGEPAGDDFEGLGRLRDAGAAALVAIGLSAPPLRVLVVADRAPHRITTDMIELLELLCAHGAAGLRVAGLVDDLRVQAATDPLTGLGHHRSFHARMDTLSGVTPLAMLVIDLDGFKAVNDSGGHAAGDRILRAAAAVLRGVVRSSDDVFRIGGDEFAIFAPVADAAEAATLGERVTASIRARTAVTASVGVAVSHTAETLTQTLLRADRALYDAKAAGRDRATVATV